jgi:glycosyltransferase involved in cell wall biosynthesis
MINPEADKIRVLFVGHAYAVADVYHDKLEALANNGGVRVGVITPRLWKSRGWGKTFRVDYTSAQVTTFPMRTILNGWEGAYSFDPFEVLCAIRRFKPDIIHVEQEVFALSSLEMSLLKPLHRCPLLFFGWENMDRPRPLASLRRETSKIVLKSASGIVCGNLENERLIRNWGYLGPTWILPQFGVYAEPFALTSRSHENQDFTIAFAGRIVFEKGVDLIVEAVAALKRKRHGVHLVICGSGPLETELQALAEHLGIAKCVTWKGAVSPREMPAVLGATDVLVLPSRTTAHWKEQFGHVLIEAMAMGIPVVGSSSGEIPNVIGRRDLIFEEGDSLGLAKILESLIRDPEKRTEVSRYCLARVERHYTHERIAEQLLQIYREILAAPETRKQLATVS